MGFRNRKNGYEETSSSPEHRKKTIRIGRFTLEHWQIIAALLAIYDYLAVVGAYFIGLWLRFDGVYSAIPPRYMTPYISFSFPFAVLCIFIFYLFHMYNSMWRYICKLCRIGKNSVSIANMFRSSYDWYYSYFWQDAIIILFAGCSFSVWITHFCSFCLSFSPSTTKAAINKYR